jgi:hypothetical protein
MDKFIAFVFCGTVDILLSYPRDVLGHQCILLAIRLNNNNGLDDDNVQMDFHAVHWLKLLQMRKPGELFWNV